MKRMIFVALVLMSLSVEAKQLAKFTDIVDAITQGEKITLVMNLQQCSSQNMPLNEMTASVQPNAFLVIDNKRITASDRHFTLDSPFSHDNPTFEFIKYTINANGSVTVKNTVMNASNYQKLSSFQIDCELNNGFKVFS